MGLKVNEITTIEVEASDGQVLEEGDVILIRVKDEDIVCRYQGLSNGYFATSTCDGQKENKYRQSSIETCYRIKDVEKISSRTVKGACRDAADGAVPKASGPLLAPGA